MNYQSTFWGILLVLIGGLLLMRELFDWFDFERFFWPVLFIVGGALLIFKDKLKKIS
ncbi:LiaI-LiaF-like domain-containing protein [Runella slithyformis]|uniref:LiaI-LiaF-like transmembrane region domain-containing protein n=1 Tax=Runella slithyformis (strain ATCC 29530 / DSM 19594 / LMG 11500 / NCIMB 11436 / LSU 4) TaxID=761193 RepID=A0A7U3ZG88_RUNSL|nr:DUF5668 domain-containing protein [Runella slithyformis]AEI46650.1 hypothetical protein Runsl_0193 [Runella slithyformis DSM 19594]